MEALLAKLTNLSYDFFGIVLPGVILNIFVLLLWAALGPLIPLWTGSGISELNISVLQSVIDTLHLKDDSSPDLPLIFATVPLVFLWYFLGHMLHWFGRTGKPIPGKISSLKRVSQSLIFHIPKSEDSFNKKKLQPLYEAIQKKFSPEGTELEWVALFPVVKCFLARKLTHSLVPTYQTKYTLHRSIVTACTFLFWISLVGIAGALVTPYCYNSQPHWALLIALPIGAIISVWGFSGSYLYNWLLFGNSIVTEAYSLLYSPKDD
jgi:hypothetical protein